MRFVDRKAGITCISDENGIGPVDGVIKSGGPHTLETSSNRYAGFESHPFRSRMGRCEGHVSDTTGLR